MTIFFTNHLSNLISKCLQNSKYQKKIIILLYLVIFLYPPVTAQVYYPAGMANTNLTLWLNASDTASLTLAYNTTGTTGTGASGNATITSAADISATTPAGSQLRLGGDVANTYTVTAISATTITVSPLLAANYTAVIIYSAAVSQWNDKSGGSNNATQATTANQPGYLKNVQNGLPALNFATTSSFMTGSNATYQTIAAERMVNSGAFFHTLFAVSANADFSIRSNPSTGNAYVTSVNSNDWANGATPLPACWVNGAFTVNYAFANYHEISTYSQYPVSGTYSVSSTFMSRGMTGNDAVGELISTNNLLSVTNRQLLDGYLGWKWGNTLTDGPYTAAGISGFSNDLVGVGRVSATDSVAGTYSTNGLGFLTGPGFLQDNGDYLTALDNNAPGTINYVNGISRLNRVWYITKTDVNSNGGKVTIYFDYGMITGSAPAATLSNYQLVYHATDATFPVAGRTVIRSGANSVNGNLVNFTFNANVLSNGYYTLQTCNTSQATINYAGSPYCSNGGTASVTTTGTAGGSYTSTTGLTINSSTGDITLGTSAAGTYTVVYAVIASGGCAAYTTSASVTIAQAPSATISYGSGSYCPGDGTASVTRTGTAGGTYSSTAGLAIDATSGDITLGSSTTGTYVVTYAIAATAVCPAFSTSTSVAILYLDNNQVDYVNGLHGSVCITPDEHDTGTLTAPGGTLFINVGFASYGTPTGTCPSFILAGECNATNSQAVVEGYVLGNNVANILASNEVFGDPCYGTFKRLYVLATYTQPICSGSLPGTITGTIPTGGNGTYTYYWEMSTAGPDSGFAAAGGTNNAQNYIPGTLTQSSWFRRTVSSGSCSSTSTVLEIPVTPMPTAAFSYPGSPYCTSASPASPLLTGTTGGVFSSTTGLTIDAGTGTITFTTSSPGTYVVTYTVAATGGCATYTTTAPISIASTAGVWTGVVNTAWNVAGNWSCGGVPTVATNVLIPAGLSLYPVVGDTEQFNNITIQSGASVTITGGTLQISGVITNSGTFDATAGTVQMNGSSSSQVLYAGTFLSNTILNLIISNNVVFAGQQIITGTLSFGASNKTLVPRGNLVLRSTALGTARIADITNAGANSGNAIIGAASIERYIPAHRAWRLLSAPLSASGAPTINAAWQEGVTSGNPAPGYGTHITGGTTSNGFDQGINGNTSIKYYNTLAGAFTAMPSMGTNTPITTYPGYLLFVRGDRNTNLLQGVNAALSNTTLRMKGQVNTGNIAVNINAAGFTLVGNPYPAAIDFHSLTKSNVNDKVYFWDPKLGGGSGFGNYVTLVWNGSSYDATASASPISRYIASGEAFFTESLNGTSTGTLTIKETDKNTGGSDQVFRPMGVNGQVRANLLGINSDSTTSLLDGVLTTYSDDGNNAVDRDDAQKLYNLGENIGIGRDGQVLSIERRHTIEGDDTTFLKLSGLKQQSYELQLTSTAMDSTLYAVVKDNYSAAINNTPVNLGGQTAIVFSATADPASYATDRFSIVFATLAPLPVTFTSVKAYRQQKDIVVAWQTAMELNMKQYAVEASPTGINFTTAAVVAARVNNGGSAAYSWRDINAAAGMHYYRVRSTEAGGKQGYSAVVSVNIDKGSTEPALQVYGNSIRGNSVTVELSNVPKGRYSLALYTMAGQLIKKLMVEHDGSNATHVLTTQRYLPAAKYQLQLKGKGLSITTSIIKE